MDSWKQSQAQSVYVYGLWRWPTQLCGYAFRDGRAENCRLFFNQTIPLLPCSRDPRKLQMINLISYTELNSLKIILSQEKLKFDDGFQSVLQPIHAVLGIEMRTVDD